jgi:hypothetical protein
MPQIYTQTTPFVKGIIPFVFDQHTPIDQDASLDIVVFDMGPVLPICGGLNFYPLNQNPPPRLKKGNKIVVLGNQGMNRSVNAESLEFGLTIYALEVSDVGQHGPRFVVEMSKVKIRNLHAPARPPQNSPHGGISGSPCFLVIPNGLCKLVGFVQKDGLGTPTSSSPAAPGLAPSSLWFTHASCLNPDGTINKY